MLGILVFQLRYNDPSVKASTKMYERLLAYSYLKMTVPWTTTTAKGMVTRQPPLRELWWRILWSPQH